MIPDRYRLLVFGVALAGAVASSAAAGWLANGWRLDAQHAAEIAGRDAELAAAKELGRLRERDYNHNLQQATANATLRDQTIRTLAAGSASASNSLRDTLAAIGRGAPDATADALRQSTTALAAVLDECQSRYRELAEKADRHASDTLTLQQAWPKNPKQE